jgi:calcineurin-like phosphoesterase family protein
MKYYYWSDTHFNHANIIKYCGRPFASVEEMNEKLAAGTTTVPPDATIVHGGDFSLGGAARTQASLDLYLRSNSCLHLLVLGNHDHPNRVAALNPATYHLIKDNDATVLVVHDPHDPSVLDLVDKYRPDYVLYGHTHAHAANVPPTWFHIGVDTIGYRPLTLEEIIRNNPYDTDRNSTSGG